tara:strand:- start:4019 stop:4477 length:459 start_codon:yes stop_codon:yes gene_type:complete
MRQLKRKTYEDITEASDEYMTPGVLMLEMKRHLEACVKAKLVGDRKACAERAEKTVTAMLHEINREQKEDAERREREESVHREKWQNLHGQHAALETAHRKTLKKLRKLELEVLAKKEREIGQAEPKEGVLIGEFPEFRGADVFPRGFVNPT